MGLYGNMSSNLSKIKQRDERKQQAKKSRGKKKSPEAILQNELISHFKKKGYMVNRYNSGQIYTEKGFPFKAFTNANTGSSSGHSDMTVAKDGKILYMEVKAGYNKLSDSQRKFKKVCQEFNMPFAVVRSIEEAEKAVNFYF